VRWPRHALSTGWIVEVSVGTMTVNFSDAAWRSEPKPARAAPANALAVTIKNRLRSYRELSLRPEHIRRSANYD